MKGEKSDAGGGKQHVKRPRGWGEPEEQRNKVMWLQSVHG